MFCGNCGKELKGEEEFCLYCGAKTNAKVPQPVKKEEGSAVGWGFLSFFIPTVGAILSICWWKEFAHRAKVCLVNAIVGFVLSIVIFLSSWFGLFYFILQVLPELPDYPSDNGTENNGNHDHFGDQESVYEGIPVRPESGRSVANLPTENSADGFVTYLYVGGDYICYDLTTNLILSAEGKELSLIVADSRATHVATITLESDITAIDAYGGMAVVGLKENNEFALIDLPSRTTRTYRSEEPVRRVAMTKDYVMFCGDDQWCHLYYMDKDGGAIQSISMMYQPYLTAIPERNLIYAIETGISDTDLNVHKLNADLVWELTEFGQFGYNYDPAVYDGVYIHALGNLYYPETGKKIKDRGYFTDVNGSVSGETLWQAFYSYTKYELVETVDYRTAVMNRSMNRCEGIYELYATRARSARDRTAVAWNGKKGYVALLDFNAL